MGHDNEVRRFGADQVRRLALRWVVVRYSFLAAVFWCLAIVAGAWLEHFGLGAVAWFLLAVWCYFALPGLLVQIQYLVDVASYVLTGETLFFPRILEMVEHGRARQRIEELPPSAQRFVHATRRVFLFAGNTSPLIGVAFWALIVLLRMPASAHVRQPVTSRAEVRAALRMARRIEFAAVEGFAWRQFAYARA